MIIKSWLHKHGRIAVESLTIMLEMRKHFKNWHSITFLKNSLLEPELLQKKVEKSYTTFKFQFS